MIVDVCNCMCLTRCTYVCICMCVYVYVCMYTHIHENLRIFDPVPRRVFQYKPQAYFLSINTYMKTIKSMHVCIPLHEYSSNKNASFHAFLCAHVCLYHAHMLDSSKCQFLWLELMRILIAYVTMFVRIFTQNIAPSSIFVLSILYEMRIGL